MLCVRIIILTCSLRTLGRVLRDDPSKSDMHNRQGLTIKNILTIITDWRLWPIYLLGLTFLGELVHTFAQRSFLIFAICSPGYASPELSDAFTSQLGFRYHTS